MNFTARKMFPNVVVLVAVVEEGRGLVQLVVEEDIKVLVVTWRSTRPMLGVDCELQPPLVDGGGRDGLLQEAGGL